MLRAHAGGEPDLQRARPYSASGTDGVIGPMCIAVRVEVLVLQRDLHGSACDGQRGAHVLRDLLHECGTTALACETVVGDLRAVHVAIYIFWGRGRKKKSGGVSFARELLDEYLLRDLLAVKHRVTGLVLVSGVFRACL